MLPFELVRLLADVLARLVDLIGGVVSPQAASGAASAASVKRTANLRELGTRRAYPRDTLVGRMVSDPLASFTPGVRDWFTRSFERPTEAPGAGLACDCGR